MSPLWILLSLLPVLGGAERFNCKGRILGGYYADAKSGCKAFHVCVRVAGGGIRDFRFYCPPGTLFHQEAQTCTDWGDDDPLACPADIYDGQFDLYKIGSGFDTKKLSSSGNRDDEAEFVLQRAETGDRRLPQDNIASNGPVSDLRAAHSSDFFSGQRDRGRDEPPATSTSAPPAPALQSRQSFRRPATQRTPPTTQYTTTTPSLPPQPTNTPQYEGAKRKLVRKRPIYVTSKSPATTFPPNTPPQQTFSEPQQNFNQRPANSNRQYFSTPNLPPQFKEYKDEYVEVSRVTPKQNRYYPSNPPYTSTFLTSTLAPRFNKKEGLIELYNYDTQSTPGLNDSPVQNDRRQPFKVRNSFNVADVPSEPEYARKKNYNHFNNNIKANNFNTNNDNFNANNNNLDNRNEINNKFNLNLNSNNNNNNDYNEKSNNNNDYNSNIRDSPTTTDYIITTRRTPNTSPAFKNFNSVSYENEKNNLVPYSKQKYYNNPTTIPPTTTIYTTSRPDTPANLNTIAYNTNNVFQTQSTNNYAESDEDDGQYHPPSSEDDGQYRPEIYDRELLTGAHSINIAASGNRLSEDRKHYAKTQTPRKPVAQTAAPRPFRPAPTPTAAPTTRAPETTTNYVAQTSTQRAFDYFKTYTTTSRPTDYSATVQNFANETPARPMTTDVSRVPETRPTRPPTRPPTNPPTPVYKPTTRAPNSKPPNKEDTSYDYAYYDTDPGFSEYDHIEEFGKTKTRS